MLEQIDLTRSLSKEEYKTRMEVLSPRLSRLQREVKASKIPVIIVFEGFGAAGKGYQIGKLISSLDPRGFYVHATGKATQEEEMHPFLWRFWTKTPENGQIAIFDRSWYRRVLIDRFDSEKDDSDLMDEFQEINAFERQLVTGGAVIIKLFLCIDQKEQRKRFKKLRSDKSSAWRVSDDDISRNRQFSRYKKINDEMLEYTDTAASRWTIIESVDGRYATVKIYTAVIKALETALAAKKKKETAAAPGPSAEPEPSQTPEAVPEDKASDKEAREGRDGGPYEGEDGSGVKKDDACGKEALDESILRTSSLAKADLSLSLTRDEYRRELKRLQNRIAYLHGELYRQRIPMVLGFEGWDAGGKGGAIKRLTEKMDPRGFRVHPTASPNDIENMHHYLWRFWNNIPKDGHIAIFDRTWYGRVMVERIEGFCSEQDWKRAYREINEMERDLTQHGTIVIKFWLQIDKDEQERRFNERMANPEKQWKITDEDWRNRAKWDAYEEAVDEMLVRTSTTYAPWVIVEGNDKYYARIKVLQTVVDAIESRIDA